MNAIDQGKEDVSGAVYGAQDKKKCENPDCLEVFKKGNGKKYHSTECKDEHHKKRNRLGEQAEKRGTIHAALLENSPRLQRVARFLSDSKPHSTRDIIIGADVCAVSTVVGELRDPKNGFDIECERKGDYWFYKMIGGQTHLLRLI